MNKVTIVTVCYNAADVIERTLKSVAAQTYQNKEYVIVDGMSSDNTLSIVKSYQPMVDKLISEKDKGIYDAMNKGISAATGEWLIFMNAGDIFANDKVLEEIFDRDISEDVSFLYSDAYMMYNGKRRLCTMNFDKGALNHQCCIYRKKLHETIGSYIVTPRLIVSDYLFFIQVPKECVQKVDTIISEYEGGGASSKFPARRYALCADVVFRRRTLGNMLVTSILQQIGDLIPIQLKYKIKSLLYK